MKKIITLLLVGLMVLSSSIVAFAESSLEEEQQALKEEQMTEKLNLKKEFTEEIHQVNNLRIEKSQLQIQIIEKRNQLVDLYIEAREIGNREALKAAKEERNQIKGIRDEIKALHEQATAAREAFREAVKNNDMETANAEIEKLIDIHSSINDKMEEKVEVLDTIIDILS